MQRDKTVCNVLEDLVFVKTIKVSAVERSQRSSGLRSDKSQEAPTSLGRFSLSLAHDQPGLSVCERSLKLNDSKLTDQTYSRKSGVSRPRVLIS